MSEAKTAIEEQPNVLAEDGSLETFDSNEEIIGSNEVESDIDDWDDLDEAVGADSSADVEETEEVKEEDVREDEEEAPEAEGQPEEADGSDKEVKEEQKALEKKEEPLPELIEVKVEGKVEKVSLDELKENYSGKVAYDKKFTDLDKERQAYKNEVDEINAYVNEFGRIAQSGDATKAMQYLASFAGIPPYQIKEMMVKQLSEEVYRREQMSEEELSFEQSQEKLKYDTERNESERQRMDQEQAQSALQTQILDVRAAQNIGQEEWDTAVSSLDEILDPNEKITPELVGKFVKAERLDAKATGLLSEFSDRLEATDEVIENFSSYIEANGNLSDEQLRDIVKAELDAAENNEKKESLNKAKEVKEDKPKAKAKKKAKKEEQSSVDDWDDLIDEGFL
jgi:hypothetical protein